ncbi:MAG: hypothetical protein UY23_C0004G0007 [Candidatus Jorgensenbacteria bacterium GW2011_GWA1_48_11]|uniref:Uncharacterized protein n=1 Tax=Candidatus Jorgensenbacteria bacterium GW2011_GWA1_48_11 TaxID=1618660 RepID=A0A0G1UAA9_9BACT|nr:MAG: hypothetical protein UY23_C0004G0007 [Candidatus Jorgensenbacteria bacterium GW2011_GWA1_48_11]KKW11812.1 MAG: hypothetical protein UY51_C0005G0053 [Candidatus Jorgensenbacteria bacterium GW2011_GWB1_49_9]
MQLNSQALAKTVAVLAGAFWFLVMGFSLLTGVGQMTLTTLGSFHPWFTYSWGGWVIIVIEHLIGGYILGYIFAWVYNRFSR